MNGSRIVRGAAAAVLLLAGSASAVVIETVPVGHPGNPADTRYPDGAVAGFGSVAYEYRIGKYEVTAGQYCEFLNAVAGIDTYGLYHPNMAWIAQGCGITRTGSGTPENPYTYSVAFSHIHRPVNWVSWGDAARFANWLHNGQPTGMQDLSTTEDGAYYLNGATSNEALMAVTRKSGWLWAIPTEDEWYKAAYYDPTTGSYFDYPTRSNDPPGLDMGDASGNNANSTGWNHAITPPLDPPYWTTRVGEFENSYSPYFTYDQAGNVMEWNEAVIYGYLRGFRGGSCAHASNVMHASVRFWGREPTTEDVYTGFRVCQIPEPSALVLLALAGMAVCPRMMRRRR